MQRFLNQSGLISSEQMDSYRIVIVGTGAIGSFVAMALTKMGFKHMTCWDPDKIEPHNLANQMFPLSAVGQRKAIAVRELVKQFSGEDVTTLALKATGGKMIEYLEKDVRSGPVIVILAVDSLDIRKQIAQAFLGRSGYYIIDPRMGARTYRVMAIDTYDYTDRMAYERTFVPDAEAVQEPCGQKSIIYTVLGVAAEVCAFVHYIVTRDDRPGSDAHLPRVPPPVVFDYGTGMRLQKWPKGEVVMLDEPEEIPI